MKEIVLYLIESSLCISVLYAIYWFFLRRDTFFSLNRCYLILMVLFSTLFPLLPFHWTPSNPSDSLVVLLEPVIITPEKVEQTLLAHLDWIEIAAAVYSTGVVIFLIRFVLQLIQINLIYRRFGSVKNYGNHVVFVDHGYSPFSFFYAKSFILIIVPVNFVDWPFFIAFLVISITLSHSTIGAPIHPSDQLFTSNCFTSLWSPKLDILCQ